MKWTDEQREAIEYKGQNILLAAAAGSGKTAVLVQRIIELVKNDKISLDELLVLTFTEAAASEMREKIKKAILAELKNSPEDEHLMRQRLLMHSASISTVHSFCLNTLKNNIQMTDLPVDFSLADETENAILLKEALDEVLERFYANIDKDKSFADLVSGYGGTKNDGTLRERLLALHNFSRSMAYPKKWLNAAVRAYKDTYLTGDLCGDWWKETFSTLVKQSREEIFEIYQQIIEDTETKLGEGHPYFTFLNDEFADIQRVFQHVDDRCYSSAKSALDGFRHSRMVSGRRKAEAAELSEQVRIKTLRDLAKGVYADLCNAFVLDEKTLIERISLSYPVVRTLKNMVLMLDRRYSRKKRDKSLLDFNDLEHETLHLLVNKKGEETSVALSLRNKYKMILVDEYQDTNNIQDMIFETISQNNSNIFMVGDLKQSIYKFRNAVPKLFSDKYDLYGKEKDAGHLIRLFKNFRSRSEVVDTVNFVFQNIMSPDVGNVDYTPKEFLVRGAEDYPDAKNKGDYATELHLAKAEDESGETVEKSERIGIEAQIAASRIREMIDSKMEVFDKELRTMRPIRYKDIVVLMRKTKDEAPIFESVFGENSIPAYSDVGHSYLDSLEINTVLSYLEIVDNPRQDIPLIVILRSPIWGFSAEELAKIREFSKDGYFFDALKAAAENGNLRADEFLKTLDELRDNSQSEGVENLLYRICYDSGYYALVGSLDHGSERQANLRILMERATEFEHTKMSGLFSFVNYIETMRAENKDMTPAKAFGEGEDVVRIMSIHKSKGLEFPVVILSNTANGFNLRDASNTIIWDEQGGIGMDFADNRMRIRYLSASKNLVGLKLKKDMISEEMRLLYVALTRAREKLIITGTFKPSEKKWKNHVWKSDGTVPCAHVRGLSCYRDWLTAALMRHPGAKPLRDYCEIPETERDNSARFDLNTYIYEDFNRVLSADDICIDKETDKKEETVELGAVREMLTFEYKNKEKCMLPVKLSVSEVKRMQSDDGEYVPLIDSLKITGRKGFERISGAERGTIVHFVLQMIDPRVVNSVKDIEDLVKKLKDEKVLNEMQARAVDCEKIAEFFLGDMGQRLKKAQRIETEFGFYTKVTADEIYGNGMSDTILLQGIIDCFFIDVDGRVVLLDFKTDRVQGAEALEKAKEKYSVQIKYYKRALEEILEVTVDETYLYFFECGELVAMD
ncbi:MAG: helicase-exonuclease AddAB subunit AddA [Clostridia bacterium]|nr:helicase-exonuclease AddAB subunit AddA [Clostridia bacterium]